MREIEVLRVAKRDIKGNRNREHESYGTGEFVGNNRIDFECQYNSKRDSVLCTCKRKRRDTVYFNSSRQVYRSQRYIPRDFREVGVGNVKTIYKKRIKRIYLPETEDRGVGSSDLLVLPRKTRNCGGGYYDQKRTSSKCVGGVVENNNIPAVSKKLSPIIHTKSCYTSPKLSIFIKNGMIGSSSKENIEHINTEQVQNTELIKDTMTTIPADKKAPIATNDKNKTRVNNSLHDINFSSVSLVQHVHNLEDPSNEKIKTSIEFIENKMENEYRKIFTNTKESHSISKVKPDLKSPSLLRRRFEALRRGLSKNEGGKRGSITSKTSSKMSVPSRKDVSIASDPPSLEARSYSNTKIHSPATSVINAYNTPTSKPSYDKSFTGEEITENWPTDAVDSECQDVKGMFKLWGKKFNLEEANCSKTSPKPSINTSKKQKKSVKLELPTTEVRKEKKKDGKRFLFFGKKSKTKPKQTFRPKQGVTAGRCELGDGLTIKIGAANDYTSQVPVNNMNNNSSEYPDSIAGKDWLKRFLCNKIDSRNSVRIRWNNNMYTTSSSTVFELMDCVYKNTGIVFSSRSELSSKGSSYYKSYMQPQVNFMQQNIQAWMIPKMIVNKKDINFSSSILHQDKRKKKKIEITFSNQKWFIDKSTAFSQKIELVLHSNNFIQTNTPKSSEYIVIDIPKGYFSDTSSEEKGTNNTSEEQVYNVVEYEQINSISYLKTKKIEHKIETRDCVSMCDKNQVLISTGIIDTESKILNKKIERQEVKNDAEQDNIIHIPNGCDVISVGIITQRDIRDIKKPVLKINDDIEYESAHVLPPPKKCEFAESFLQDYYRNWTSLGIDMLSCISDYKLRGPSENNSFKSFNNQGDGSKSCPNIYNGYQTSTIVSSCETSSCSHCMGIEDEKRADDSKSSNFFTKLLKKSTETSQICTEGKRVLPKDSLEVFKRRKLYAASNKSKWGTNDDRSEPFFRQSNFNDCPKVEKVSSEIRQKKKCKKRVILPDCDVMDEISDKIVEGILNFKGASGCDICKNKSQQYPKQAKVSPHPICDIPQPPCKETCVTKRKPACSKKNSPTCNVPTPPSCPAGHPTPCQKPCPPSPPPCQMFQPCMRPPPTQIPLLKSCSQSSIQCTHKPIPPKLHSPKTSSSDTGSCVCPREPSLCDIPKCPVQKNSSCISYPGTHSAVSTPPECPIPSTVSKSCSQSSTTCAKRSIQRIHPPENYSSIKPRSCVCPKKNSLCDIPQQPVNEKSSCNKSPQCFQDSRYPCQSCKSASSEKCQKSSRHDFPWPLKNQVSNEPSKQSGLNLKMSASPPQSCPPQKPSNKGLTTFKRLIQKLSSQSIKDKECKPDCANRRKLVKCESPVAPPPTAVCPPTPNNACQSTPKISGLFLKKLPMPKNCSKECLPAVDEKGVIRLNSREKISIKLKQSTPSTEEIREGCNIKVLDDDGQTLYERRDYRKVDRNRMHFVQDLYKDSQVQRVSTPNPDIVLDEKSNEINQCKSNTSVSNIIEINLSLKFKNGDKTAEFNTNKADENSQHATENSEVDIQHKSCKDIYVLQEKQKATNEDLGKKDVNISITIKNYKTPVKLQTNKHSVSLCADEFSRNITKKFQSVSTGYSDIIERQNYSVHRTTIDLTNSTENNQSLSKVSVEISNRGLKESTNKNDADDNGSRCDPSNKEKSVTDDKESDVRGVLTSNTISEIKIDTSIDKTQTTNDDKSATTISFGNTDENLFSDDTNFDDKSITKNKKFNKEEKKELLKKLFETASEIRKTDNTSKLHGIRHLLRAVLTSDSSHEDFEVNNELTKQFTYDSLKPKYINSAVNYLGDSSISTKVSSKNESEIYPTRENGSECSDHSVKEKVGCLCKHFATRLNINKNNMNACCCRGNDKVDKEVVCNMINENICSIDIYTQYTNSLANQGNAVNLDTGNSKRKIHEKESIQIKNLSEPIIDYLDDKINLKAARESGSRDKNNTADVLQLNEMKKAVLEIYAERTISGQGTHMIARLPKFICDKESEIYNYETIAYSRFSKKNIVLSIAR